MGQPRALSGKEDWLRKERRRTMQCEWVRNCRNAAVTSTSTASSASDSLAKEEHIARLESRRQEQNQRCKGRRQANATDDDRATEAKRKREAQRRLHSTPAEQFPGATAMFRREFVDYPFGVTSDSISDPLLKLPEGCPVYDAYVCYTAEDFPFVQTLVEKLERPELGIRLFLPERDLCAGVLKYNTFFQLMEKWCKKTIIIFSPEFLKSHECRMQQKFIESIEIEQAQQKLIPVVIKPCALDGMIRMISKINLCETASALSHWSWNNLISSIKSSGNGSFVQRAPSLCALRLAPSPPEVRAPSATRARTPVAAPKAVEVASHSHKGKAKWLSGIFSRKKNNSVSSASSGFQSMATPE